VCQPPRAFARPPARPAPRPALIRAPLAPRRSYVALEGMVRELSQSYVKAHALVEKNREKCEFPRGAETGGGRMNSMY